MSSNIASLTKGLTPQQLTALERQNHDGEVYICAAVFSALALLAVAIRVTSRHLKKVPFGIDDLLIVFALVISIAQAVYICIGVRNFGLGRHLWTLNKYQFVNFNKLWYSVGTLQCSALFMTKTSLLILFHRVFITPAFRLTIKIIGIIMVFWWIGTILADSLICIPVSRNWDPTIPGHCGNKQLVAKIPPVPWIVTDFVILLLPIPMVWKMHLPQLQRMGLVGLFLLGGFSTFTSCFRYSLLFYQPDDVTYHLIPATVWTIIELDVTIITVCLIVCRPWLLKVYPSKLISVIHTNILTIRKSSSNKHSEKRWQIFSSFKRLDETPPAVNAASMGAPFEFDVEKQMDWHADSKQAETK